MITKKQILWLIALAIMTVMVSVACKKKPTDVGNYMSVSEAGQTPAPEFPSDNPIGKLAIDTNQGLIQFNGLSFRSGAYYINGNYTRKIYYYADVKVDSDSKPYVSAITKSEDGEIIEDEGKFYDNANGKGAVYNLEGVRYQSNNRITAEVTFTEDGYLRIKFSNYGLDITYSLTTEIIDSKSELEGTWKSGNHVIEIDSNGNITLNCPLGNNHNYHYSYTGKLANDFNYPYAVKMYAMQGGERKVGTLTFNNSSSATGSFYYYRNNIWDISSWSFSKVE